MFPLFRSPFAAQSEPPSFSLASEVEAVHAATKEAFLAISDLFTPFKAWPSVKDFLPLVESSLSTLATLGYITMVGVAIAGFGKVSVALFILSSSTLVGSMVTAYALSQRSFSENVDAFAAENKELKTQVELLKTEVATLGETNKELKETSEELKATKDSLAAEVTKFSQENSRLEATSGFLARQVSDLRGLVQNLRQEILALAEQNRQFRESNEELRQSIATLEERLRELGMQERRLNDLVTHANAALAKSEENTHNFRDLIDSLSQQIAAAIQGLCQAAERKEQNQQALAGHAQTVSEQVQKIIGGRLAELRGLQESCNASLRQFTEMTHQNIEAARTLGETEGRIRERDEFFARIKQEIEKALEVLGDRAAQARRVINNVLVVIQQQPGPKAVQEAP